MAALAEDFVTATCQPGTDAACRYIATAHLSGGVWSCLKLSSMAPCIDRYVAAGIMDAVGDNCEGIHQGEGG